MFRCWVEDIKCLLNIEKWYLYNYFDVIFGQLFILYSYCIFILSLHFSLSVIFYFFFGLVSRLFLIDKNREQYTIRLFKKLLQNGGIKFISLWIFLIHYNIYFFDTKQITFIQINRVHRCNTNSLKTKRMNLWTNSQHSCNSIKRQST